jgi:hypothetical protein
MYRHRATLLAFATFLTLGTTTAAFAGCCDWGTPAPVAYASGGCGGCGTVVAPITYATPIAPAPIVVGGCGGCGTYAAPSYAYAPAPVAWGTGCGGCGQSVVYAQPAPLYVVNQGPAFSGPGVMVPYRYYTPPMAAGPYPYLGGYRHHYYNPGPRYGYRGYGYRGPAPYWRPRHPLGARG